MSDIEMDKELIPQFVVKLYQILEKREHQDYICWAGQGTEVLIKNQKKIEEKVLPQFFRHRQMSSFIRQLNMYKFSKVNKVSKERSHMFFRNDFFRQGAIQDLKLIKRKQKEKKNLKRNELSNLESISIEENRSEEDFAGLKEESLAKFAQIQQILVRIIESHSEVRRDLNPALKLCQAMTNEKTYIDNLSDFSLTESFEQDMMQENNMLGNTTKDLQGIMMNSLILPSVCSLANLEE